MPNNDKESINSKKDAQNYCKQCSRVVWSSFVSFSVGVFFLWRLGGISMSVPRDLFIHAFYSTLFSVKLKSHLRFTHSLYFPRGCSHTLFVLLLLSFFYPCHFFAFRHLPPWADKRKLTHDRKCSSPPRLASWPSAELGSQLRGGQWDREAKCQRWDEKVATLMFQTFFSTFLVFSNVLNLCCTSQSCFPSGKNVSKYYLISLLCVNFKHQSELIRTFLFLSKFPGHPTSCATKNTVGHSSWQVSPFAHSRKYNILFMLQGTVCREHCQRPSSDISLNKLN